MPLLWWLDRRQRRRWRREEALRQREEALRRQLRDLEDQIWREGLSDGPREASRRGAGSRPRSGVRPGVAWGSRRGGVTLDVHAAREAPVAVGPEKPLPVRPSPTAPPSYNRQDTEIELSPRGRTSTRYPQTSPSCRRQLGASLIKPRGKPPRDEEGTRDGVTPVVLTIAWGGVASSRGWTSGEQPRSSRAQGCQGRSVHQS